LGKWLDGEYRIPGEADESETPIDGEQDDPER
jgi:endogenous inhibitor of DNA gyrase (YacG/DUF329 family)